MINNKNFDWNNQLILIVEDDFSSYIYLNAIIKKTGAKSIHAANGKEAVEKVKENLDIDLVLMDIQLPILDGYAATKAIKQYRKNLPVIVQTANAMEDDRSKSFNAGCDDYISKPIDKEHLLEIMEKFL